MTEKLEEVTKEDFDKTVEKIKKMIAGETLRGEFWGRYGALSFEKQLLTLYENYNYNRNLKYNNLLFVTPVGLFSMASSTYYAAGGNAGSRAKASNLFLKLFWYWRGWKCLRKAEKYSDEFSRVKLMEDMSLGELDTRACILDKRGRRNEAAGLLSHGIMKILTGQMGTKHDLCLFLIHEAEIIASMRKYDKENKAEKNYQQAVELLEDETVPTLTKVRVMKSYGKFLAENKRINEAESVLGDALDLARDNKLYDQEVKIKAIFKKFKLVIR